MTHYSAADYPFCWKLAWQCTMGS